MGESQLLETTTLDGRILAGASTGPQDGIPVLFIAGAGTGRSMTFGDEHLERLGVRLITMDRPGMGASTPHPRRDLASTVNDYRYFFDSVADAHGYGVRVIANSQGSVFSLALASQGEVDDLLLVSPADEVAFPSIHAQLPPQATQLADLAATASEDARAILAGFSAEAMEEMVLAGSPDSDRTFYTSEPFRSQYRASLREGFAHDGAGYVCDTLLAMRPWNLNLENIDCPVHIMFGQDDASHSPDLGQTLAHRIPNATREVLPQVGGALLWTHAEQVLGHIADGLTGGSASQ